MTDRSAENPDMRVLCSHGLKAREGISDPLFVILASPVLVSNTPFPAGLSNSAIGDTYTL